MVRTVGPKNAMLRDTLYNCFKANTKGVPTYWNYARGVFTGTVGTMMAMTALSFQEAIAWVAETIKQMEQEKGEEFDKSVIPDAWVEDFTKEYERRR